MQDDIDENAYALQVICILDLYFAYFCSVLQNMEKPCFVVDLQKLDGNFV